MEATNLELTKYGLSDIFIKKTIGYLFAPKDTDF